MNKSKYVMIDEGMYGEVMYIFPDFIKHCDVVQQMGAQDSVVSAGFLILDIDEGEEIRVQTYGNSTSLELNSREEDTSYARQLLGLNKY